MYYYLKYIYGVKILQARNVFEVFNQKICRTSGTYVENGTLKK